MLVLLAILLLVVLLFGGLGLFVAKVFFVGLLVALLLSIVTGGFLFRGHGNGGHSSDVA
ncbi:MAG: hypothetical protein WD557_11990 [Dehalococcoidia bacterium]